MYITVTIIQVLFILLNCNVTIKIVLVTVLLKGKLQIH